MQRYWSSASGVAQIGPLLDGQTRSGAASGSGCGRLGVGILVMQEVLKYSALDLKFQRILVWIPGGLEAFGVR